jgi:type II secretory pathway component PulJ
MTPRPSEAGFSLPDALAALVVASALAVGLSSIAFTWRKQAALAQAAVQTARAGLLQQRVLEQTLRLLGQASGGSGGPNRLEWACAGQGGQAAACSLALEQARLELRRGEARLLAAPAPEGARLRYAVGGEWLSTASVGAVQGLAVAAADGRALAQAAAVEERAP